MPIQEENGFLVTRDLGITPALAIETGKIDKCIEHINRMHFRGVFGSPSFGFKQDNLNFLDRIPQMIQLWFWDINLKNIDAIYSLEELRYCGINPKRPSIDFSRLPKLKTLISDWNRKDIGLASSNIAEFYLWHYNPNGKTFDGVEIPLNVSFLELNWVNPPSLNGMHQLPFLKELGIHRSRNLESLDDLLHIAPCLKKLIITTCNRVKKFSGIENHPSLEFAIINGRRIKG